MRSHRSFKHRTGWVPERGGPPKHCDFWGPVSQRFFSRADKFVSSAALTEQSSSEKATPPPGQGLERLTQRAELEIRGKLTLQPWVRDRNGLRGLQGRPHLSAQPLAARGGSAGQLVP